MNKRHINCVLNSLNRFFFSLTSYLFLFLYIAQAKNGSNQERWNLHAVRNNDLKYTQHIISCVSTLTSVSFIPTIEILKDRDIQRDYKRIRQILVRECFIASERLFQAFIGKSLKIAAKSHILSIRLPVKDFGIYLADSLCILQVLINYKYSTFSGYLQRPSNHFGGDLSIGQNQTMNIKILYMITQIDTEID